MQAGEDRDDFSQEAFQDFAIRRDNEDRQHILNRLNELRGVDNFDEKYERMERAFNRKVTMKKVGRVKNAGVWVLFDRVRLWTLGAMMALA